MLVEIFNLVRRLELLLEKTLAFDRRVYTIFRLNRGDEWSLRAFAGMPSTAIFLRARAEIKKLLCELASNAKIWGARASEHSFKFCEQLKILMDHSSPL